MNTEKRFFLLSSHHLSVGLLPGILFVGAILVLGFGSIMPGMASAKAMPVRGHTFVDNKTCIECHADQAEEWLGSHHEKAMQVASQETVLGNFNDVSFTDAGVTSRFFQKDDKYFVNTEGSDGKYADFEVKYTFGVEPLQQYLLALPKGRLQAFTVAWDTEKKHWFDLYPDEKIAPENPLHWSKRAFTANSFCMECHMTNMSLNFDVQKREYHTTWNEVNVSCQSCHGPGSEHVAWAKDAADKEKSDSSVSKGLLVDYKLLDSKGVVESCARCHSRRYAVSENDAHGRSYFDDFTPELLRQGSYHADGQILDEVYVYGSFVQSKMYHKGVSCNDCHNPHSLKLRAEGNAVCTSCHQATPLSERFATLTAKTYDAPEHHFHKPDSAGAQCANCHMPQKTYMLVDPRHDHSFVIPRPDLTAKWGTPDACTDCHTDQSADWSVQAMNKWYGEKWQERPSIAGMLTQARTGAPEALSPLTEAIKDPEKAAIIRATALDLLPLYGQAGINVTMDALKDVSPLVRTTALQGLENLSDQRKFKAVTPLLNDPVRGVRIEAARLLATIPREQFREVELQHFDRALEEYKAAQRALADHPEGHLNLGNLYARMGQLEQAQQAYRTAIDLDAYFTPAYNTLGQLYYATGRRQEAADIFRQALQTRPDAGDTHYSLALLLVELQQPEEALVHLGKAASLMPEQAQIHYNYGLLLQKQQKIPEAEKALLRANELAPADQRTLQALSALYRQQGQTGKEKKYIQQLRAMQTGNK